MSLFTEDRLRNRVGDQLIKGGLVENRRQKAERIISESLNEQRTFSASAKIFDIFLSHSSGDAELVAGLKLELEDLGYSVYVDWIEDPKLNSQHVTRDTALVLKQRMQQSKSLIYAFSENASSSKWMPWELGYFDGLKRTVAILPISKTTKTTFTGSEYLGIYYYIQIDRIEGSDKSALWIHESAKRYVQFNAWVKGSQPVQRG